MILIFSEGFDLSTNQVMDWIKFHKPKTKIIRINHDSAIEIVSTEKEFNLKYNNSKKVSLKSIKSIWFRRINTDGFKLKYFNHVNLDNFLRFEHFNITQYIFYQISKKITINGPYNQTYVNRLIVLDKAKEIGLQIPLNFLLSNSKYLEKINNKLITKTVMGSTLIKNDDSLNYFGVAYTNEIGRNKRYKFDSLNYFEEKIEKLFELRIFYFNKQFYPMAIFSQKDNKTKIDFRHYNINNPNRTIPFKLPLEIEIKLLKLMASLALNSGSIDMIVSKDNEYYFLEVNPVGQFGMVSFPCNYNVEMQLAKYLLNEKGSETSC